MAVMAVREWDSHQRPYKQLNMIQIVKRMISVEDRLLDTELNLIKAVKRTIGLTESMIYLVRNTTQTTQSLMAPQTDVSSKLSHKCICKRIAAAKNLVKAVGGLNQTAGRLNQATDHMIKLSNSLAPRDDAKDTCVMKYLSDTTRNISGAVHHINKVEVTLQDTVRIMGMAVKDLESARELSSSERDSALKNLLAMSEGASGAATELRNTVTELKDSGDFLRQVIDDLCRLQDSPDEGVRLMEEMECPVCYQVPLSPPVWVCRNGHSVCASCRPSLLTCPACRGPLGYKADVLVSAWLRSLMAWCQSRTRGSLEEHTPTERAHHNQECLFLGPQDPEEGFLSTVNNMRSAEFGSTWPPEDSPPANDEYPVYSLECTCDAVDEENVASQSEDGSRAQADPELPAPADRSGHMQDGDQGVISDLSSLSRINQPLGPLIETLVVVDKTSNSRKKRSCTIF